MINTLLMRCITLGLMTSLMIACGSNGGGSPTPGTAGTTGAAGTGSGGMAGSGAGGTGNVVVTPEGMLFMDDFEAGAAKWDVTQGTCSIMADGTSVFNCINGGNEARAVAGMIGWGEYSVQAKVKVNAMDAGRRIYLAARYTDSSNWYGAAIYNGTPVEVQIRKKVGGTSSDIVRVPFAITFGTWYTLKLEVKGSTIRLSVDGVVQLETTDTQFASGQIALLVDRSDISWDDVIVTNP
jgi:pectate lyase